MTHMGDMETYKGQTVSDVWPESAAQRAGIRHGDTLLFISGEPVKDIVDYEYLSAEESLTLTYLDGGGARHEARIQKESYEPLGLNFASGLMDDMRTCKNKCVFCFIDQMHKGGRSSLHIKDDDWRMSFIMGNYVSLTNLDERELARIIARRVSPLFISMHASDPAVRVKMMANPNAGRLMEQLRRLKEAGLSFHLQIVLCPGLNDGDVLARTLQDAETLVPAAKSLAIVPVGLTKFREGLYPLTPNTPEDARRLIDTVHPLQERLLAKTGTRFVFLSDEWYILAKRPMPDDEAYEDFPQIENGVGLLRLFEKEFLDALQEQKPLKKPRRVSMAGGVSACGWFDWMPGILRPYGIELGIFPITNEYFGHNVNVGGLVTGGDLTAQLAGRLDTDVLLIPHEMLREQEDVFLDGMTLCQAEEALHIRILPVCGGEDMITTLFRRKL